ncbi:MAG: hypothetical protein ACK4EX_04085 [Thermaurantimonas sp.]|uniref:hypothetical protein n=1 Tax=Thermaurantimonas sp. TaxID=2681568 RepID=UPI00391CA21F
MNIIKIALAYLPFAFVISSCTYKLAVPEDFEKRSAYHQAQNRQSWPFKKNMTVGPYLATNIRRGWTESYHFTFVIRWTGASERYRFVVREAARPEDTVATVFCFTKIRQEDFTWIARRMGGWPIKYENVFAVTIALRSSDGQPQEWEMVYNEPPMFIMPKQKGIGLLKGPAGQTYNIESYHYFRRPSGKRMWSATPIGFAILKDGKEVAVADIINKGGYYLSEELDTEEKNLLTSACMALLLRRDLRETHERAGVVNN